MRCTTLTAAGESVGRMIDYYVGLAEDRAQPDRTPRGAVDYYLDPDEPAGRWWGRGVDALGVGDEVLADDLRAVLDGRHPLTGTGLGRRFGDRSARGFDCTFSAPKSVSVLWAVSPDPWVRAEVLAAHESAVDAALGWFEHHGAVTRRGKDGVHQVDTRGVAVALFRQHTSRTIDPQLHTHALVSAKVQDTTGRWLSLDARFLKRQQRTIGWVYDAALRAELTARLGVDWRTHTNGRAKDLAAIDDDVCRTLSERSQQVAAKHQELIARWIDDHNGHQPDSRTIADLERSAVVASRPAKEHGLDPHLLHDAWTDTATDSGLNLGRLTGRNLRSLNPPTRNPDDDLVTAALRITQDEQASWLPADIVRNLTTLIEPGHTDSASELTSELDRLANIAVSRCIELGPRHEGPWRRDGRPISEAVTDRRLSSPHIVDQEQRLQRWAEARAHRPEPEDRLPEQAAADAIAGHDRLVIVVGPAGAGKTTATAAGVKRLQDSSRHTIGLAPSGKAADVLSHEADIPARTVASFLNRPPRTLPPGTTIVLDEASMITTDDLAQLIHLTDLHHARLVAVGDPAQLPSVGRGGVFAHWCDTVEHIELDTPRRFTEPWEAKASLMLRAGDPSAAHIYDQHNRLDAIHPALLANTVAATYEAHHAAGRAVAITTPSTDTARQINQTIQRRRPASGPGVNLSDGTIARAGDQIATRQNDPRLTTDRGHQIRNRHTWAVNTVRSDGAIIVQHPKRGTAILPAGYAAEHVELGWAVTGYGNQGDTVDTGIAIIEPGTTRAHAYVALTRGRHTNLAIIPDPTGTTDPTTALAAIIDRIPDRESALTTIDRLHQNRPDGGTERVRQLLAGLRSAQREQARSLGDGDRSR